MKTLGESLSAQQDYLLKWGRPHEADHSLNDKNRDLIQLLAATHDGRAFLGAKDRLLRDFFRDKLIIMLFAITITLNNIRSRQSRGVEP